ncbi:MAG: hypothetical protein OXC92_00265 [Flavobacteriaceae bacterium]|nr:hypothetical protein [Flavobacteriaceae bacterium]
MNKEAKESKFIEKTEKDKKSKVTEGELYDAKTRKVRSQRERANHRLRTFYGWFLIFFIPLWIISIYWLVIWNTKHHVYSDSVVIVSITTITAILTTLVVIVAGGSMKIPIQSKNKSST